MNKCEENGFGFPLFSEKNLKNIARFVLQHEDGYGENYREFIEACENDDSAVLEEMFGESASFAIARIINRKEGTTCVRGYDTSFGEYIGIEPIYHWMASDGDKKKLNTKDDAVEFLSKYAEELGITEKPDYFTAYYYG